MKTETLIKTLCMAIVAAVILSACGQDDHVADDVPAAAAGAFRVGLQYSGFGNDTRSGGMTPADYDHVEFLVADGAGNVVRNMKGYYDMSTSTILIEGLQPGSYTLLIAGVRGDMTADGAAFAGVSHTSEPWLVFPGEVSRALSAEYFHSSTGFSVRAVQGPGGQTLAADLPATIEQKRLVGRLDVDLKFNNPYMKDAVVSARAVLHSPVFHTAVAADGRLTAGVRSADVTLDLAGGQSFLLLPTAGDEGIDATVTVQTRNYLGDNISRSYTASAGLLTANRINTVQVEAHHPEDGVGTMFVTAKAYAAGGHRQILQDDEHHSIYTDKALRSFNTSQPLQVSVTGDGQLNVRFSSPKPVAGVLIRALIPSVADEHIDLAFLDSVPAFADFYGRLPLTEAPALFRTRSGRIVEVPRLTADRLREAEFTIESPDPYWAKLQKIKHGWNVRFDLYGGDPTRPDGGPQGNWMGIRPVHCREVVAFFLNFTYMIDMPEHEAILRANEDRLYGNGGVDDKVTAETVLEQMRQARTVRVGLVYTGNNVMGLGGGDVFGAYQGGWFEHYTSAYACEVMFHELGHVMGYSHDSSFTYGPWAQELMNNFYINNISEMPVESPHYLNSASNPNRY